MFKSFIGQVSSLTSSWKAALLAVVILLALQGTSMAVPITWTGGTGNWNNALNWSPNGLPNSTSDVGIDGGVGGTNSVVTMDISATIDNLTIDSGDTLNQNNNNSLSLVQNVSNAGTMTLNSGGNITDLTFNSGGAARTATLSGGGTITMSNNTQNRILDSGVGGVTLNTDNTIQGAGQILMDLNNTGTINANQTSSLTVDPDAGGAINTGTMQASGGGRLRLNGGSFTNTGGLVRAATGSTVEVVSSAVTGGTVDTQGAGELQLSTATITGGTITNSATGIIRTTGGSSRIGGIVSNVAGGQMIMGNNTTLRLEGSGTYTNNGTFNMNSVGNVTDLIMTGGSGVTLGGAGTLSIGNNAQNRIYADAGERLTNTLNHTIEGGGQLGRNLMAFTNQGTVDANLNGVMMTVDPNASGAINTGTMQASNGGVMRLNTATYTNTGGTIQALTGSRVELHGASITDGILHTAGTGVIRNTGGAALENVTLNSLYEQGNNIATSLRSSFTNNGTFTMNSVGNVTDLIMTGVSDVNLSGTGTITMSNNTQNRIRGDAGQRLTHGAGHTIEGAGQIGVNSMGLTNLGLIDANQTNTLTIDPDAGGVTNSGTMRASGGGTLVLSGGDYANFLGIDNGLIRADNGTVRVQSATVNGGDVDVVGAGELQLSTATITGGTITNSATGIIRTTGGSSRIGGIVSNVAGGQMIMGNNTTLRLEGSGTYTNNGTFNMNSVGNVTDLIMTGGSGVTLGGAGTLSIGNNAQNRIYADAGERLTNTLNHTIEGAGQIGVNSMGLTNLGTINANQTNSLTIDLANTAGSAVNDGTLKASNGGTLVIASGSDFSGTGNWVADAGTINLSSGVNVTTTGNIDILNGGSLNLTNANMTGNDLNMTGAGSSISVNSGIALSGNYLYSITNEADAVWGATSTLQMNGFDSFLELGGQDFGINPLTHTGAAAGFNLNFDLTELIIGSGAKLHLADFFDNANRIDNGFGLAEALYVDTLTFADATGLLNLNGLHLYYNNISFGGLAQIIDEIAPPLGQPVPEPSTIALLGIGIAGLAGGYWRRRLKRKIGDRR